MSSDRKPLYLLADSQLLFWDTDNSRFIDSLRKSLETRQNTLTKAAYIGASNGDVMEYFDLFVAAMDKIDIHESRMISSAFDAGDKAFLQQSDLILLAGGDFASGWEIMADNGIAELVIEKYYSGAVLIGVSAGAMQLGMGASREVDGEFVKTSQIMPYFIDVHSEHNNWCCLRAEVKAAGRLYKGFGISSGGGMIYYPDSVVEPLRKSLHELYWSQSNENEVLSNILLPP